MDLAKRVTYKKIIILVVLIFLCVVIRTSIAIWENINLGNKFTVNPEEPYQKKVQISELGFIDDYIYRIFSPFAAN